MGSEDKPRVTMMAEIFPQEKSVAQRIFENIIFIEEVFADRAEGEIPDVPMLELAKSFELKGREDALATSRDAHK